MTWEPIEEAKAKKRQGMRNDLTSGKVFPEVEDGRLRDIIARRVGLGSGVTKRHPPTDECLCEITNRW